MALYSPNTQKPKSVKPRPVEIPSFDPYELSAVNRFLTTSNIQPDPYGDPLNIDYSQTSESSVPPLEIQPTGQTIDQGTPSLDLTPRPVETALDRYNKRIAQIRGLTETDPTMRYRTVDEVNKPTYNDPNLPIPSLQRGNLERSVEPSLDAALLMGGLSGVLNGSDFGSRAGLGFLGNSLKSANNMDAAQYNIDKNQYEDAYRSADRRYAQDVDRYGVDVRAVNSGNEVVARRMNDMLDSAEANFRTEQTAETQAEKIRSQANREKIKNLLKVWDNKRISLEDAEKIGKQINEELGSDISGMLSELTPEQSYRFQYLTANKEQRKALADKAMALKKDMQDAMIKSVNDRARQAIQAQKDRQAIAIQAQKELAQYNAAVRASLAQYKAGSKGYDAIKAAEEQVKQAHVDFNRVTTSMNSADRELTVASRDRLKPFMKQEFLDPSYIDPKDDSLSGLNENGRQAMKRFTEEYNNIDRRHNSTKVEYNRAKAAYQAASENLRRLLDQTQEQSQTSETPALQLPSMPGIGSGGMKVPSPAPVQKKKPFTNLTPEQRAMVEGIKSAIGEFDWSRNKK